MRFKNRYVLLEVVWKDRKVDEGLNEAALLAAVRDGLQACFGDVGMAAALATLQVKYYNPWSRLAVLRCSREQYKQVLCTLTLLSTIKHRTVLMRTIDVSGVVNSCRSRALAYEDRVLTGMALTEKQAAAAAVLQARLRQMVM